MGKNAKAAAAWTLRHTKTQDTRGRPSSTSQKPAEHVRVHVVRVHFQEALGASPCVERHVRELGVGRRVNDAKGQTPGREVAPRRERAVERDGGQEGVLRRVARGRRQMRAVRGGGVGRGAREAPRGA